MKEAIEWTLNHMPKSEDAQLGVMSLSHVAQARSFHTSFPQYSVTPLADLEGMAKHLGLSGLYVKDESYRFGLNAFKVLGGSFAMGRYIAKEMGRDVSEMTYGYLTSEAFRREFCAGCGQEDCEPTCPHQDKRDNPAWWLKQEATGHREGR